MPRLAHQVFFTTKDRSDETINALLDDCQTYLNDHPGLVGFAVGRCEPDYDRPVNMDFDVVLHTVFEDRAAHDAYQTAPRHLEFIERQKPNWAEVRVFDSNLRD
ncbi:MULTISPECIES: Dabb family protein [Rhodopirellula]|jgi:quinol monooxygenase YgiN|uniref:Stress responsive alpha-beta barrel domain protein n=1 Tax=Rhodopirellula europaea 6C TaxID=1263867 RepID=M2AS90_9BACT|nr:MULTISPECIES: Dabb family protein [Rhodopirellula]EMB15552.1 Stress responsive alpha-beta barrel domain protein [Rhodopirellula europaea 6C]MAP09503.1 stress responsive protein [Rhodopirellula sp.]MCR9210696.1 Dabb family protein [bacterium]|tara:strand:+ start:79135 stop:79446 length:312 start_codon:yes stop_codon:yes gene_type:complete